MSQQMFKGSLRYRRSPTNQAGVGYIEAAITLLLFLVLAIGAVNFSRYLFFQNLAHHGADKALHIAAVVPGLEKFGDPTDPEYQAALSKVYDEGKKLLEKSHAPEGGVEITKFNLVMPTLEGDETVESALNSKPIKLELELVAKSIMPPIPDLVIRQDFFAYREPRHSTGLGPVRDCANNLFFSESTATASDCNCPAGCVVNSSTGQCGCPPFYKDIDPNLSSCSCECNADELAANCPENTQPNLESCTCEPCPGATTSPGGGVACSCSNGPPAGGCNTRCQLEAATGRWVGLGVYSNLPCTPRVWNETACACACPEEKSTACPPAGVAPSSSPYASDRATFFNTFFCECTCGGAAVQGFRLNPSNSPPDQWHDDDYECSCGDGSGEVNQWASNNPIQSNYYWCSCTNTCTSPQTNNTSACYYDVLSGTPSGDCCACECPGGSQGKSGPGCDQCPPAHPGYAAYTAPAVKGDAVGNLVLSNNTYVQTAYCCPPSPDPNGVAVIGGTGCIWKCRIGYSLNIAGHVGTCWPVDGQGGEG